MAFIHKMIYSTSNETELTFSDDAVYHAHGEAEEDKVVQVVDLRAKKSENDIKKKNEN